MSVNTAISPLNSSLLDVPGVVKVEGSAEEQRLTLELADGTTLTVTRTPLAEFRNGESFDVWLPPSKVGMAADVVLSKSAREVIDLVRRRVVAQAD